MPKQPCTEFWAFWQKINGFFETIFLTNFKHRQHFWNLCCWKKKYAKLLITRLLSSRNCGSPVVCSQVWFPTKHGRPNYYLKLKNSGICWYGFWQHGSNFWIETLYKLFCDPQASCIGTDLGTNMKYWSLAAYKRNKIKLVCLFSWVNQASIRPKSACNLFNSNPF